MKIDASRYSLFLTNPEEFRIKYLWNIQPTKKMDASDLSTYGRRRGTAFHELTDGKAIEDLTHLGESAVETARLMYEYNQKLDADLKFVFKEREFCIPIPGSTHEMVGRIDSLVERNEEKFILDYKTTKYRTKADLTAHCDALRQNPQIDFYLAALPDVDKFVYRLLWKKPSKKIDHYEIECVRSSRQLTLLARSVHQVCETILFWKEKFGIEQPWPAAISLKVAPEFYSYQQIYQRQMFDGVEWDGFEKREEHLDCMREGQ